MNKTQNQFLSKFLLAIENLLLIGFGLLILCFVSYVVLWHIEIVVIGVVFNWFLDLLPSEDAQPQPQYQKLTDGRVLQIINDLGYSGSTEVRINHQIPDDGLYLLSEKTLAYKIEGGKIKMEYYIEKHKQEDGKIIEFAGSRINGFSKGCPVWLNGEFAPDGEYKKGWFSKIRVENGRIKETYTASWLHRITTNLKVKRITITKIREAYVIQDSKYLIKAYTYGQNYFKRAAVEYLGEIITQENFEFLINEMKVVKDEQIKSYIYASIMNLATNESIKVTDDETEYLEQHMNLLENIGYLTEIPKKESSPPIVFSDKKKDYFGMIEANRLFD